MIPTKIGNLNVPKNCIIISSMGLLHQEEKNFIEPELFDPNRFLDEKPSSFGGFGLGTHPCPGQKMALMEIKLLITTIFFKL